MYHTDMKDDQIKSVCKAAFPSYKGRTVKVNFTDSPMNLRSYWDGGSRDYFAIVRLSDCKQMPIPAQSGFDPKIAGLESFTIPSGFVVVEHSYFCGKDMGLTIHARKDGSLRIDKPTGDLSELEMRVLNVTAGLKSSYAGIKDMRAHELKRKHGYSQSEIDNARVSLIAKGFMNKNKAINNRGRNALENEFGNKPYQLRSV